MESIMLSIFPSSYCYCGTSCTTKQTYSHKHLGTFFFSNQYSRREFVFIRESSINYELRSLKINGQVQNSATGETSHNKRSVIEGLHQDGDILAGKYKITGILGQGGSSITYEAEAGDGEKVALKAMSLRNMRGWKELDLFERECRVLQSLQHPSIPQYIDYFEKRLKIDFKEFVPMSSHFANIVERLLEPAPEDRFQSADEVVEALMSEDGFLDKAVSKNSNMRELSNRKISQPAGTKVVLTRTSSQLKISIPPGGITAEAAGTGTFAVAWNAFIAFWTGSAIRMGAPLFFTLFSLPFWFVGIRLAQRTVSSLVVGSDLNFGPKEFSVTWKLGSLWSYKVDGQTKDIISVGLIIEGVQNGQPITVACVKEGVNSHTFGASLELIEKKWLVNEINDFLGLSPLQQDSFPKV